jgi:hypothetical protein
MKANINHVDMIDMKTSAEKLPSFKLLAFLARSAKNNNNHTISRFIISWPNLHDHKHTQNST